jgi:HK97 family phage portal protein
MSEQAIKNAKSGFNTAYAGVQNAGKIVYLYDGATFTPSEIKSTDAQFLELRRFQTEEIARAFNMSPSMLGDLTKSSYANAEQKQKEFLAYALEPWLCALESAFNRALLTDDERATLTFRFDRDDLSRADLAVRANAINSLIASEVINPNTGASWLGLAPHAGGETYGNRNITVKPVADPGANNGG